MKRLAYSAVVKPLATKAGCVLLTLLTAAFTQMALAVTTFYVTTNGTGNLSGSDLANATNNLQGAIDTIETGATNTNTVWVSNGVYSVGGVTNYPAGSLLTNRVAITKAITVQSWNNDPMNTIIKGSWSSNGQTNGADAVRGVYLAANSRLIGFTLTNGATLASGDTAYGAICGVNVNAIVSNCIVTGCTGKDEVIGYASLYNCSIINNPFTGDSTYHILACTLYNCVVAFNTSYRLIGDSIIYNSLVVSNNNYYNKNSSYIIGGRSSIYNSIIAYNIPYALTGSWPKMQNCLIYGNKALYTMIPGGTLTNCTIVGNRIDAVSSTDCGGGVGGGFLGNSNCSRSRSGSRVFVAGRTAVSRRGLFNYPVCACRCRTDWPVKHVARGHGCVVFLCRPQ